MKSSKSSLKSRSYTDSVADVHITDDRDNVNVAPFAIGTLSTKRYKEIFKSVFSIFSSVLPIFYS